MSGTQLAQQSVGSDSLCVPEAQATSGHGLQPVSTQVGQQAPTSWITFLHEAGSEPQAIPLHERAPPEPPLGEAPPAPPDAALIAPPSMDVPEEPVLAFPAVPPVESAVAPPGLDVPIPPVPVSRRGDFPQAPSGRQTM